MKLIGGGFVINEAYPVYFIALVINFSDFIILVKNTFLGILVNFIITDPPPNSFTSLSEKRENRRHMTCNI